MNQPWSEKLIQKNIADFLIEDLLEEAEITIPDSILKGLKVTVESSEDLEVLSSAIDQLRDIVDEDLLISIEEEYDEISDDLEWSKTDKGQSILKINDWAQSFYEELRSNESYKDVMVGGHTEKDVIFVTGKVTSGEFLEKLKSFIDSKQPPMELLYKVEVVA
ncbi:hypothetical protein ACU6U9_04040 [Pseudomonas sp. HK3]